MWARCTYVPLYNKLLCMCTCGNKHLLHVHPWQSRSLMQLLWVCRNDNYSGTSIIPTPLGPYQTVYYRGVLSSEVGHSFASHTNQLAKLTCVTETTQTSKEGPKVIWQKVISRYLAFQFHKLIILTMIHVDLQRADAQESGLDHIIQFANHTII